MISGHVFIATSLDGFIAREDGDIEWLLERDKKDEDHGFDRFIEDIDAVVMGRGTFEAVRHMTPWFYRRPVLVLSTTLAGQEVPSELAEKVRFAATSPRQTMAMLAAEGCRRVYVDGGQVIQSFLSEGLISDLVITRVPIPSAPAGACSVRCRATFFYVIWAPGHFHRGSSNRPTAWCDDRSAARRHRVSGRHLIRGWQCAKVCRRRKADAARS